MNFIFQKKEHMKNQFEILGMSCGGCSNHVEKVLRNVQGVTSVEVNLQEKKANVEMNTQIPLEVFVTALKNGGGNYTIHSL